MIRYIVTKKSKSRDYLLIASAVLGLIAFIAKEVLQAELTNLRDSLAAAESQFSKQSDQSALSIQILTLEQQMQALQIQKPVHDFSALIAEDTALGRQLTSQLDANYDALSKLINAFPVSKRADPGPGRVYLRDLLPKVHEGVEKVDQNTERILTMPPLAHDASPSDGLQRYVQVVSVKLFAMVEEIPMVILGDFAQTSARRVIDAYDASIRFYTRVAYLCGLLAVILFVYSAIARGKPLG